MDVKGVAPDVVFRNFTACVPPDPRTLLLDVRPNKEFKKQHVAEAYNIRLAANGRALLDYSKNTYEIGWTNDCWWHQHVIVYGGEDFKKDHPVLKFLAQDNHAKSLSYLKGGFAAFQSQYSFLCTDSVRRSGKRYPSEIIPGLLYLGAWEHALERARLQELNIRRVLTIHNNPEDMVVDASVTHLRLQLADVLTEDISQHFSAAYDFIEAAREAGHACLVHCGAGVSRSAALCIAYLMRRQRWSAHRARAHCQARRSVVAPNDGFWAALCALEAALGLTERSDIKATAGGAGADAPAHLAEGAAGRAVKATFLPASAVQTSARQASHNGSGPRPSQPDDMGSQERVSGREGRQSKHSRREEDDVQALAERRRKRRSTSPTRRRRRSRSRSRSCSRERGRPASFTDQGRPSAPQLAPEKDSFAMPRQANGASGGAERTVKLEVVKAGKAVGAVAIPLSTPSDKCVVGRAPSCGLVLDHQSISRQHAELSTNTRGEVFLTDLGSGHGTNVDGVWLRAGAPRQLKPGAVFKFGASSREYKVLGLPAHEP